MGKFKFWGSGLFFLFIVSISCNDPSIIGEDLLEDELINVEVTDTMSFSMKTIELDSVRTLVNNTVFNSFMLGENRDEFFGYSKAEIYTDVHLLPSIITLDQVDDATLDSAVLVLGYDLAGFYGDTSQAHTITVHRMQEVIDNTDTIFTSQDYIFDPTPIGQRTIVPNSGAPVEIMIPGEDTLSERSPQLRIRLTQEFANVLKDTSILMTDSIFTMNMNGLHIESSSDEKAFFGINLTQPPNSGSNADLNKIILYLKEDTIPRQAFFQVNGLRTARHKHDFTGSQVESFIDNEELGDSLAFLQGMSGVDIQIDLANIHNFQGNLLNKVELEIIVAELVGDDIDLYAPPRNMVMYRDSEEFGIPVFVEDAALAIGNSTYFFGGVRSDALPSTIANLNRFFGGNVEDGYDGGILFKRYRLNLTSQCVEFLRDESLNTKINIAPFIKAERPNRCIIFGPKHSVFPAKVNIKYTKP